MEPILAYRLADFNLTQQQIGLFFTLLPVLYIVTSVAVQYMPKTIQKRAVLITAIFLSFFVNICVGPSIVFGFPDSLFVMGIGQLLHGLVDPFIIVPSLPEMIDAVVPLYPNDEFLVNDLSSGIFNCFLGIGQIVGPLYGSLMTQRFGFRYATDYVAIFCFFFSIFYFFFGDGYRGFRQSRLKQPVGTLRGKLISGHDTDLRL